MRKYDRWNNYYTDHLYNFNSYKLGKQKMTEKQIIRAMENIAEMYYHKTKDKWWLKLAIYTEKRLDETTK